MPEFKKYTMPDSDDEVYAALVDEPVNVDVVGIGPTTVSPGNYLIMTPQTPGRYDVIGEDEFNDLGYTETQMEEGEIDQPLIEDSDAEDSEDDETDETAGIPGDMDNPPNDNSVPGDTSETTL